MNRLILTLIWASLDTLFAFLTDTVYTRGCQTIFLTTLAGSSLITTFARASAVSTLARHKMS